MNISCYTYIVGYDYGISYISRPVKNQFEPYILCDLVFSWKMAMVHIFQQKNLSLNLHLILGTFILFSLIQIALILTR